MRSLNNVQIGVYQVVEELHTRAGMSRICRAYDTIRPEYPLALKINAPRRADASGNPYQDFIRRESALLTELRHPGVVRILPTYQHGQPEYILRALELPDSPWYFAMEFLEGGSLTEHLPEICDPKKYPLSWIIELFYQLAITVHYLHHFDGGYVHCDIKPDNILLRQPPDPAVAPLPVLIDFGNMVRLKEGDYIHRALTREYAPPELEEEIQAAVAEKRPATHPQPRAIDMWMLGITFFELISGRSFSRNGEPFRTTVRNGKIDKLHEERPDIPAEIDTLLEHTLVREPEKRLTIEQLIAWTEILLGEQEVALRPPRIQPQIPKRFNPRRWLR